MIRFLIRRLLHMLPILILTTAMIFSLTWLVPGDPARAFVPPGEVLDAKQLEIIRKEHNFDKPIVVQYLIWLGRVLRGDLGRSMQTNRRVTDELLARIPVTLSVGLTGWFLAVLIAVPAGILSAVKRGRWPDYLVTIISIGAVAIPGFWLGIMMVLLFSVKLGWLPVQGYVPFGSDPVQWARHLLLPAFAIGVTSSALIMRQTRSAMLEVMAQDYVRTARAKGMSNLSVVWIHTFRNALLPVVTVMGLQTGQIFAGAVVIESMFGIPGVGNYIVQSIFQRDFLVAQGGILLVAFAVLAANLVTDIAYAWLDPRVKVYG
jgi:peptide/nickel transport system permease protein